MRRLAATAVTLLLSSSASADVLPSRALVRIDLSPTRFGSGVFVSEDPPIVATCYHVVANESSIRVMPLAYPDGSASARVTEVLAFPSRDVALLKLDVNAIAQWGSHVGVPAVERPYTVKDVSMLGFGNYYPSQVDIRRNHILIDLVDVALMSGPSTVPPKPMIDVFELETHILAGDSGGPVFLADGTLVGLAGGRINRTDGEKRYFAIPLAGIPIDAVTTNWRPPPVKAPLPYVSTSGASIVPMVWDLSRADLPWSANDFSATARSCRSPIEQVAVAYTYDRPLLPQSLPGKVSSGCQKLYARTRTELLNRERAQRAATAYAKAAADADESTSRLQGALLAAQFAASTRKQTIASAETLLSDYKKSATLFNTQVDTSEQERLISNLKKSDAAAQQNEAKLKQHLEDSRAEARKARELAALETAKADDAAAKSRAAVGEDLKE